ncbi:MAG: hydroxymethylglutaryl-CoA lyase [Proteobacteria bacterium]|nr:hydroxymethylglutaryl-CoA lyase [Burkholderiales bacterium]
MPDTDNESDAARLGGRVYLQEVAMRDGLQAEAAFVPTDAKVAFIDRLSRTGLAKIEATSFTSPKAIPMLADADEVMRRIERVPGVDYAVLVANVRGVERALASPPDEFNLVLSCSETHNLTNLRMTRAQSVAQLLAVMRVADGARVPVNVSLSCTFGCPMEGDVPEDVVLDYAARFIDAGAHGISLCDTTGMAFPAQVTALCLQYRARFPHARLTLHGHNTRGIGLANVMAALAAGVDRFDASLGGLGGCPYAPGATGNVCTEDLAHLLALQGYATGVDLDRLLACARALRELVGHEVPGQVAKAGRRLDLHPVPDWFDEVRTRALKREVDAAGASR